MSSRKKKRSEAPVPPPPPVMPKKRRQRGGRKPSQAQHQPPPPAPAPRRVAGFGETWPLYGLLVLLAVGPLFRGLFFTTEQLVAFCVLVVLALAHWKRRFDAGEYRWFVRPLDYAVLGMFVVYALATFVAADYRSAVQSDIKWLMYFLDFWLMADLAREARHRTLLFAALAVAGVFVSIAGIGAATGTIPYNGAYLGGRIYSTFQYPNATAAYLAAVALPTLALADGAGRLWVRALWTAAAGLDLLVFFLTYSRGALLVLPVALLIYWLLLPAGRRGMGAVRLAVPLVVAVALFDPVHRAFLGHAAGSAWALTALAAAAAAAVDLGIRAAGERLGERRTLLGAAGLAVLGTGLGAIVAIHHLHGIFGRLTRLNLGAYNAWSRLQWMRDGVHIWTTRPILGYGGGGWAAVYQKFQSYGYFSTQAHDVFAQVLVGAGIVGFLTWVAVWLLFALAVWAVARRGGGEARMVLAPAAGAALMIGMHGSIDFDLSLSAITLAMFALFGVVRALRVEMDGTAAPARRRNFAASDFWRRTATYCVGSLCILGALSLMAAQAETHRAQQLLAAKKTVQAIPVLKQAIGYDPLSGSLRAQLANIDAASTSTGASAAQITGRFKSALSLDPFNVQFHTLYGSYLLRNGHPAAGLAQMKTALDLAPFHPQGYDQLANDDVAVASAYLHAKQKAKAAPYLAQVAPVAARLKAQSKRVPPQAVKHYPLAPTTPQLRLDEAQAQLLTGKRTQGLAGLRSLVAQKGLTASVRKLALLWLATAEHGTGQKAQAAKDAAAAKKAIGKNFTAEASLVQQVLANSK